MHDPTPASAGRPDDPLGANLPRKDDAPRGASRLGNAFAGSPKVLVPYDRREALSLREAAKIAGRCEATLRSWAGQYDIGRRIGNGPWQISRVALAMFLDGDGDALRAYLSGDRTGALVEPYFARSQQAARGDSTS